ncbi:unnamed protein product [Strongylus vulgaris]|uniref:Uncharacterized protein n=1 Tax=Strongylus vulgaris TaxID=40348 RepID=A0A3P7L0A9_STRVU|nr:unnamed protein product [Strongylus vulgaris]
MMMMRSDPHSDEWFFRRDDNEGDDDDGRCAYLCSDRCAALSMSLAMSSLNGSSSSRSFTSPTLIHFNGASDERAVAADPSHTHAIPKMAKTQIVHVYNAVKRAKRKSYTSANRD